MAKTTDDEGLINQQVIPQLSPQYQKPQDREGRHDASYDNDVGANWLRGMGKGEAEGKPFYDKHKSGGK